MTTSKIIISIFYSCLFTGLYFVLADVNLVPSIHYADNFSRSMMQTFVLAFLGIPLAGTTMTIYRQLLKTHKPYFKIKFLLNVLSSIFLFPWEFGMISMFMIFTHTKGSPPIFTNQTFIGGYIFVLNFLTSRIQVQASEEYQSYSHTFIRVMLYGFIGFIFIMISFFYAWSTNQLAK